MGSVRGRIDKNFKATFGLSSLEGLISLSLSFHCLGLPQAFALTRSFGVPNLL